MAKPTLLKKLTLYLQTNGYSDPASEKAGSLNAISQLLLLPARIGRVLGVLRGVYFDHRFDRKHNVNTCGAVYLRDLDIESENIEFGELYDPFPSGPLKRLLSFLPQKDLSETTFVDFGSGKGRILFVAAMHAFRKILGVEFSPELHEVAQANIQSFRSKNQKCHNIESLCEDATQFQIPEGACVFFIFASFHGEVFTAVLENIKRSFHADPRPMFLLYVTDPTTHPIPWADIEKPNLFRKIQSGPFPFDLSQRYPLAYAIFEAENYPTGENNEASKNP